MSTILMEENRGGWLVQLRLMADGRIVVQVDEGEGGTQRATWVPPEKALDAFEHPYVYFLSKES